MCDYNLDFPLAIKILQKLNFDLCLINVELAKDAENVSDSVLLRLPFKLEDLTWEEKNALEKYCFHTIGYSPERRFPGNSHLWQKNSLLDDDYFDIDLFDDEEEENS